MKKTSFIITLIFLLILNSITIWGSSASNSGVAPLSRSASALTKTAVKVSGTYPYFEGNSFNVNQKIQAIITANIKEEGKSSTLNPNLSVSYRIEESGNIVSVILTSTSSSGSSMEKIDTVVFDNSKGSKEIIRITDDAALGKNGIKIANKKISATISKNPGKYNVDFSGIGVNADFYIKDNSVYLVFDKYEISPGVYGTQEIAIDKSKIKNFKILSSEYVYGSSYNIRMIPLRKICKEGFDYDVRWHNATPTMKNPKILILKDNFIASLSIGINEYSKNNFTPQILEAPPEIRADANNNGITYVPISFAETILDLFYYVDSAGNLVFSSYEE